MNFNVARLRVKELAEALSVDTSEIIATCIMLKIPASTSLSSISVEQSKEIIDVLAKVERQMKIKDKVKIQLNNLCENFWDLNIFEKPIIKPTKVNTPR